VIVSTTSQTVSGAIRIITRSPVSHAVIYIGNNSVIEAVEEGVTIKPIEEMLNGASLAVAFRYPNLTPTQTATINDFAFAQLGKRFNVLGILRHPRFSILPENCNAYSGKLKQACTNWRGLILLAVAIKTGDTEFSSKDEFFCSQLVADAYKKAGIDLFRVTSATTTPGDIPILAQVGELRYVGHLKR
jgi:cell wall-associated NlpC family hydrolase